MADKFQPEFYITCATVIPVLFLAVAVQGRTYASLVKAAKVGKRLKPGQTQYPWQWVLRDFALLQLANFILLAGSAGEGMALYVLYRGAEWGGSRIWVLLATLLLVAIVATGPLRAILFDNPPPALDQGGPPPQGTPGNGNQPGTS
jgi:hypothetical protein